MKRHSLHQPLQYQFSAERIWGALNSFAGKSTKLRPLQMCAPSLHNAYQPHCAQTMLGTMQLSDLVPITLPTYSSSIYQIIRR